VRGSYLKGNATAEFGAAAQMMTVWRGAVVSAGVALPRASLAGGSSNRMVVFASLSAAILQQ